MNGVISHNNTDQVYFLTELIGIKTIWNSKRIGKLTDFLIVDKDKIAEVTHIFISRPFGEKSLLIPWEKVKSLNSKEIVIDIANMAEYEGEPGNSAVLLKDHILDKKVLDVGDREVEVVYRFFDYK